MLFGIAELFWLEQPAALNLALFLGILGASVLALVYRYWRVSNALERQQTSGWRWASTARWRR